MKTQPLRNWEPSAHHSSTRRAASGPVNCLLNGSHGAPLRFKRILVPTDFSKASLSALWYAKRIAEGSGAAVYLVHVLDQAILTRDFEAFPLSIPASELAKSARVNLLSVASADFEEFVHVKPLVRTGKPFREIVSLARQENIDLIVIATHGRTGLNRMVLGSTAEQVIRHAPCPVLVVRDYQDERRSRELPRPKRQRLHGALKRKAYRHGA